MRKTMLTGLVIGLLTIVMAIPALANGKSGDSSGRPGSNLTVIVDSTGLTYDSIVTAQLPAHGPFQELAPDADGNLHTAYGPGDVGYLGGRWWADFNGNGEMDQGETFLCPLLGPGS